MQPASNVTPPPLPRQSETIAVHRFNRLVFVMETECVYCAVRADPLSIIQVECDLQIGRAVEVSVGHWPGFDLRKLYGVLWTEGPVSVVGIATGYGLDSPGIESRLGRDFPHLSRPALGPTQPHVPMGTRFFPG